MLALAVSTARSAVSSCSKAAPTGCSYCHGRGASGRYSSGARQFAANVAMQLRLIDGKELTQLMVKYNVGVQVRESFDLKQIDEESFAE